MNIDLGLINGVVFIDLKKLLILLRLRIQFFIRRGKSQKIAKSTHGNSHLYRPVNFRGQRAHIPKFSQPKTWDQSDRRKYLESIRHETIQKRTRV